MPTNKEQASRSSDMTSTKIDWFSASPLANWLKSCIVGWVQVWEYEFHVKNLGIGRYLLLIINQIQVFQEKEVAEEESFEVSRRMKVIAQKHTCSLHHKP